MEVQIKNKEEKKLIDEMYQQKKRLLNSYYLVFTIATSGDQPTNSRVIRKYSIKLAKNEILNQATNYSGESIRILTQIFIPFLFHNFFCYLDKG